MLIFYIIFRFCFGVQSVFFFYNRSQSFDVSDASLICSTKLFDCEIHKQRNNTYNHILSWTAPVNFNNRIQSFLLLLLSVRSLALEALSKFRIQMYGSIFCVDIRWINMHILFGDSNHIERKYSEFQSNILYLLQPTWFIPDNSLLVMLLLKT